LSVEDAEIFSDSEMEGYTGVRLIKKRSSKNIFQELIGSIDRGMPVIVAGDAFYLEHREDTYNKRHTIHFLLVYGYDKSSEKFIVNDHSYANSWIYTEYEVSFESIKKFSENYAEHLSHKSGIALIKIKKISSEHCVPDLAAYKKILKREKDRILKSRDEIEKFCAFLIEASSVEEKLRPYLQSLPDCLGAVRWKMLVRRQQLKYIIKNENIHTAADRVLDDISFITGVLAKVRWTVYNEKSIEKLRTRVIEYLECERTIHNFLLSEGV